MKRATHFSAVATGTFTVATLPDPVEYNGAIIIVSDGNAGASVLAFSDGVTWKRSDTGAAPAMAAAMAKSEPEKQKKSKK